MGRSLQIRSLLSLFPNLTLKGSRAVKITGVCSHSKQVAPGMLFVARRGRTHDGGRFIHEALKAGAVAIASDLYDHSLKVPQIITEDLQHLEGPLAAAFYGYPSHKMATIGITGTSGKTSVSYLLRHLLEGVGIPTGLIGTVEVITGRERGSTGMTTPDPSTLQRLLHEMVQHRCRAAILEATSHGLAQGRLEGTLFSAACFTNLTHEHLDYHGTMEAYAEAKGLLFRNAPRAALNGDDPWHTRMGAPSPLLYGLSPTHDLYATDLTSTPTGTHFTLHYRGKTLPVTLPLAGRFNVYNALAALAVAILQDIEIKQLTPILATFPGVPGRLERIPSLRPFSLYVDFAHKPDALEQVLVTLRPLTKRRLITVVGCGGDRDRAKRPLMGEVATRLSDITLFTSDNPRTEEPAQICQEMAMGGHPTEIIVDRRSAIAHAIAIAEEGDTILIAGRGHEQHQILAHGVVPFDDRQVAKELLT
ncbi:MAG: UDP-N-acetylmuramoyl-L-alanyl-D-glutamate--2,6-diaminopimelate ligase [Parachlamydiales bacterium]